MRNKLLSIVLILAASLTVNAVDFTWKAQADGLVSTENGKESTGYLWVADSDKPVECIVFAFQNMNEETLFNMERFRERMGRMNAAILWIAPGFGQEWDVYTGCQDAFDNLLANLAAESHHPELTTVPLVPFGHSAQATMPWNFAAWNPQRTLCVISYHGDAPRTNLCGYGRSNIEWGRTRNIDGIPGLMVMGEYEWWMARLLPAIAFKTMYPGSCISFLGDEGRGHFDVAGRTADYIALFIEKAWKYREGAALKHLDPADGWRAQMWEPEQSTRAEAAPWHGYKGNPYEAFWYPDREMAEYTEARYADAGQGEMSWIGFMSDTGSLMPFNPKGHCKITAQIEPDQSDCFTLQPVFTDSTRTRINPLRNAAEIKVCHVSGPAIHVGGNTFRIDRTHPTWDNPRRRAKITLVAEAPASNGYKETVQEIEITVK